MNLMNKNGSWMYQDKEWHIPAESYDGGIEDQDSGDVLGLLDNATVHGSKVDLQDKMRSLSEGQRWTRGIADRSGWFKLKNPLSGRVLTAQTSSTLTISGTQKHFKFNPNVIQVKFQIQIFLPFKSKHPSFDLNFLMLSISQFAI